jgi:hypothetical protein
MVAGPYTSGARTEVERQANLDVMNESALQVFEKGHVPIIGVNLALPIIQIAGLERFEELMMPISLAAADRCDACLRVGGPSDGADREMKKFESRGLTVYRNIDEIPTVQ